jgi:branched-chain amino acid transport system permease protein
MTFIGGIRVFWGPILGTVLVTLMQSWVSLISNSWPIYLGLLFIVTVMYAPGGIAGMILLHRPLWQAGRLPALLGPYARVALAALVSISGLVALVELWTFITIGEHEGEVLHLFGRTLDPTSAWPWGAGVVLLLGGGVAVHRQARVLAARWAVITGEIKAG